MAQEISIKDLLDAYDRLLKAILDEIKRLIDDLIIERKRIMEQKKVELEAYHNQQREDFSLQRLTEDLQGMLNRILDPQHRRIDLMDPREFNQEYLTGIHTELSFSEAQAGLYRDVQRYKEARIGFEEVLKSALEAEQQALHRALDPEIAASLVALQSLREYINDQTRWKRRRKKLDVDAMVNKIQEVRRGIQGREQRRTEEQQSTREIHQRIREKAEQTARAGSDCVQAIESYQFTALQENTE